MGFSSTCTKHLIFKHFFKNIKTLHNEDINHCNALRWLAFFPRRAQQEEKFYAVDIECNCGMYRILSEHQIFLHQMRKRIYIQCHKKWYKKGKVINPVKRLPPFIPYQL